MTPHIEAKLGDYADAVIMPGDPKRAEFIAKEFLNDVQIVNTIRNNFGFTGFYKDTRISVQASGMGQASLSIYANELLKIYGVQKIIRIGTCGALKEDIFVGDIVVAMSSATESNITNVIPPFRLSPCCSYFMLKSFMETKGDSLIHVGQITSNDNFYQEDKDWGIKLANYGVLAVDMETHALYHIASKYGRQALTVNLVSDSVVGNQQPMTPEDRVIKVKEITTRALESLI